MFSRLKGWIRTHGGYVHDTLTFDENERALRTSSQLPEGTEVLRLPNRVILSCNTNPPPTPPEMNETLLSVDAIREERKQDVLLSLFLASKPLDFQAYLDILPRNVDLPVHWTTDKLKALEGSPVLRLVHKEQENRRSEFAAVSSVMSKCEEQVPMWDSFNLAMSFVQSRAFSLDFPGKANVASLIPLLDLCNHVRGSLHSPKSLSYGFEESYVVVRAVRDVAADEILSITYGARSNALLFLHYGFCVEDNNEPDGSSNDTFDLGIADRRVELRVGPKAYTYGKFVQALECLRERPTSYAEENQMEYDDDGSEGNIEAFLDECEEDDCSFSDNDWEDDRQQERSFLSVPETDIPQELRTLNSFDEVLRLRFCSYVGRLDKLDDVEAAHVRILIQSEKRILLFFHNVVRRLVTLLSNASQEEVDPWSIDSSLRKISKKDARHVVDLVGAYVSIRHKT